jgi:hypothetical protein
MKKISCKINDNITFELRNVIEVNGHDDSLPFNADIYLRLNGRKRAVYVGYAYNDGWGGDSIIRCKNNQAVISDIKDYLRDMMVPYNAYGKIGYLPASLPFLIDLMVEDCLYKGTTEYDFNKNFVPKKVC